MSELHRFLDEARTLLPAAVALRRRIHKKPELGLDLPLTTQAVLDGLQDCPRHINFRSNRNLKR
jgi:metal-dependent amidase/aminoacylase/carboxypeptidase family protein